jgi:hypothetical protein
MKFLKKFSGIIFSDFEKNNKNHKKIIKISNTKINSTGTIKKT